MRIALLLLAATGCSGNAPPCQPWQTDKSATSPMVQLTDESPTGELTLQVAIPDQERYPSGTPVVVYVHGGWGSDMVPLTEAGPRLRADMGFATVYVNLPGGDGESASEGSNDLRGTSARQALGAALRYAEGGVFDNGRCTLEDRLPGGTSGQVVLAGWSNGGNLAWATAADSEIEIPTLDGIATFETPTSAQFLTVEPGTTERPGRFFDALVCDLTEETRLSCPHGYPGLAWDPDAGEETDGALFIDANGDGVLGAMESTLDPVWSPADEAWIHPIEALAAATDLDLTHRASPTDAAAFWAQREAPLSLAGALARFPNLVAIATGTEIDHVLTDLDLPVHVTGLVSALQSVGFTWSRLHPDAVYVAQVSELEDAQEYDADMALDVVEPLLSMEPEDGAHIRGTDYLTAAVLEIMDRSWAGDWSEDLRNSLVEHP